MTRHASYDRSPGCPVEAALDLIGGEWKGVILHHLLVLGASPFRFGELRRRLPGVTQRTLTEMPPRGEHAPTPRGRTSAPVVAALEA